MREEIELSIIAPAFNEQDCLPLLVRAVYAALAPLNRPFEILLVDDASTDGTAEVIRSLAKEYSAVRPVTHLFNCGQSAAVASGFRAACGCVVITMDADMQNPPSEIPRLLAELTPGTDAVCGVRRKRNDQFVRRLSSRVANSSRDWITGVPVRDAGCGFRVIRKEALREIPVFNGMHRFLTTILKLQGFAVKEVEIAHAPRPAGKSKYGIHNRLWRGIADCFAMRWYAKRVVPAKRCEHVNEC
ncbi:MAG: glycosyltransferase family 2 protein [Kiritimatiellales bacterium]